MGCDSHPVHWQKNVKHEKKVCTYRSTNISLLGITQHFFNLKCNKKDSGGGTVQRARTHVSCRVVLYCIVKKEDFLVNLKKTKRQTPWCGA